MKKHYLIVPFTLAVIVLLQQSCTKKGEAVKNPFNDTTASTNNNKDKEPLPASIEGLHKNLFKPTCANSGCHDGTFEPDFRTIQSSYNTLINIAPVKKDPAGIFNYRVVPGNAAASMLIYRMTEDLGGNSGIMPLVVNPDNPYPSKKQTLIQNLKDWINNGAADINGVKPAAVDFPPQIMGVQAVSSGTNTLPRGGKYEPITASAGSSFQLWFAFTDDKKTQDQLTGMTINWSSNPDSFNAANEKPLISGSKTLPGLYGGSIVYGWYYNFNTTGNQSLDVIWIRITCNDGTNANYRIPNANSMFFLKKYFALRIN